MRQNWVALVLILLAAGPTRADVTVQSVRAFAEDSSTRIVLDLDASARHNLFTLRQPNRVVVDIDNARLADSLNQLPADVGVVRTVRAGERNGKGLRIVLDLDQAVQVRSFFAGPAGSTKERLVIDLGERARAATVRSPANNDRDIIIAIDPGHGGRDPGAIGKNKTREKDVVLAIGRKLAARINAEPGLKALLVRDRDVLIPLRDRMEAARRANADLFISIHADAVDDRRARGSSVYALSVKGASDEAATRLAATQNVSLIGGIEIDEGNRALAELLIDLSQNAAIASSVYVGEAVLAEIGKVNRLHRDEVQHAGFIVLKSPDVPSILVETAYISNPAEERNLTSRAHQKKLVDAIFHGVQNYFSENPPVDTLYAKRATKRGQSTLSRTYTIAAGDTLSDIADRYRISVSNLRRENALKSDRIRVGQVLRIPSGG
ncbi:MAG: N-acetylmuramoyl-L-alanine amidase [Pseudomonadota bacterium]